MTLALLIAFYLELDNPFWAGTSASIVCQPVVGASFRKGLFRVAGTLAGAVATVTLAGLFPQNRVGFLVGMGIWAACCSFANSLAKNFAAYGFALAGYTMLIIASDSIDDPSMTFHFALIRSTEIIIGIVSAMLVMGLSDIGRAKARLATSFGEISDEIADGFADLLARPTLGALQGVDRRRTLLGRIAALFPVIDQVIGEEPGLRRRADILEQGVSGLMIALSAWHLADCHMAASSSPHPSVFDRSADCSSVDGVMIPDRAREPVASLPALDGPGGGAGDAQRLADLVIANAGARLHLGLHAASNALASMFDRRPAGLPRVATFSLRSADPLSAILNALRTFIAIEAALSFWVATEWPTGLIAVVWVAVTVLLHANQFESADQLAFQFGAGSLIAASLAAICEFSVLPNSYSVFSLSTAIAIFLIPISALSSVPIWGATFVASTINFMPMLLPTNPMTFDLTAFLNNAVAIIMGCFGGSLAFWLIPSVPANVRAERALERSCSDLDSLVGRHRPFTIEQWEQLGYHRRSLIPVTADASVDFQVACLFGIGAEVVRLESIPEAREFSFRAGATLKNVGSQGIAVSMRSLAKIFNDHSIDDDKLGNETKTSIRIMHDLMYAITDLMTSC